MKELLILSFALVVLAGCKGSVPQADYVAPARTATGAANSSPAEMKYICQSAKRGETPSTGDCARNWFSAVVNSWKGKVQFGHIERFARAGTIVAVLQVRS
jgi:hypothetical protein